MNFDDDDLGLNHDPEKEEKSPSSLLDSVTRNQIELPDYRNVLTKDEMKQINCLFGKSEYFQNFRIMSPHDIQMNQSVKNDEDFRNMHGNDMSIEKYKTHMQYLSEAYREMLTTGSLDPTRATVFDPKDKREVLGAYFDKNTAIAVEKYEGKVQLSYNGRHRLMAAKATNMPIPVIYYDADAKIKERNNAK